ncbi:hypothetical protein [Streptomyces yangpuensis]|uniref:hypothetical protein n=1 Tax=Streptomyces yangpuensis TaxID=1648182 RepID=UPI00099E4B6B|nr:hypothetical protein [Streptomyces yangpuensis]
MPTPYGSRGGMAFSAAELHVLRRSLAHALQSSSAPLAAEEVQDCLRLAQSVDEAVREAGRLRAFVLDDLARYRGALPGSLPGYLALLREALAAGYEPVPDDLAALRALRANPAAAALLERARAVAERSVRRRLTTTPAPRTRLLTLAGGQAEPPRPAPAPKERPRPERPVPTPGEVFPPRRKPAAPPASGLAVV